MRPFNTLVLSLLLLLPAGCHRQDCDCARPDEPLPAASTPKAALSPRDELNQTGIAFTPETFLAAASHGDLPRMKLFLNAGMPVDARIQGGQTALMWASGQGKLEAVKLLISTGADVNGKSADSNT